MLLDGLTRNFFSEVTFDKKVVNLMKNSIQEQFQMVVAFVCFHFSEYLSFFTESHIIEIIVFLSLMQLLGQLILYIIIDSKILVAISTIISMTIIILYMTTSCFFNGL